MSFTTTLSQLGAATLHPIAVQHRVTQLGEHASEINRASERLSSAHIPPLPGGRASGAWAAARDRATRVASSHARSVALTSESIGGYLHASVEAEHGSAENFARGLSSRAAAVMTP